MTSSSHHTNNSINDQNKSSNKNNKDNKTKRRKKKILAENLNILYANADILTNKTDELETILERDKIDVALICETLPKNPSNNLQTNFNFEGYVTIECNEGRGVCIIYKETLQITELNEINKIFQPSSFIEIKTKDKILSIGIIYRSPNSSEEENSKVREQIEYASQNLKNLIITGDFNHPEIDWENCHTKTHKNHRASKFIFTTNKCKFHQLINEPTHYKPGCRPTLIDLVITKDPELIEKTKVSAPIGKSFHCSIFIKTSTPISKPEKCMVKKYQIDKGDYDSMRQSFKEEDWDQAMEEANEDVDKAWEILSNKIKAARDKYIPSKMVNTNRAVKKRFFVLEDSLVHLTKLKRYHFKVYKKYPSTTNYKLYTQARARVSKYTREKKRNKEKKIARNIKNNSKEFYQYIRSKITKKDQVSELKKTDGSMTSNDMEKSTELNNFFASVFTEEDTSNMPESANQSHNFKSNTTAEIEIEDMKKLLQATKSGKSPGPDELHPKLLNECANELAKPLKYMFDLTMKHGKIPEEWKKAEVKAIYKKKGSKSDPSNYRPVSLTSVVCKLMEKIIKKQLNEHLKDNNIIADEQYGFYSGRSTETQLLTCLHHWQKALDSNTPVDVIYMDFRKAFDSVPHARLVKKLSSYGVQGNLLKWIESFLTGRTQHVNVNNQRSEQKEVISGVPQGSVLGPTLFIYFINDLPLTSTVETKIFADDTKVYTTIESPQDKIKLQETVDNMHQWTKTWLLKFNEAKCNVLHLGGNNPRHTYFIGDEGSRTKLTVTKLEKDLGVHIDENLNFEQHIEKITKKAASRCANILKNFTFRSRDVLLPIFKSMVRPILEYANCAWNTELQKHKDEIESIQRSFTKNIFSVKKLSYEQRLENLKLPSLEYRRLRGDLIQTFKILRQFYDIKTVDSLFQLTNNNRLRGHRLKLTKHHVNKTQYKNFFTNRIVNQWNHLPSHIIEADSVNSFKNKIDEHLKDKMYKINLSY